MQIATAPLYRFLVLIFFALLADAKSRLQDLPLHPLLGPGSLAPSSDQSRLRDSPLVLEKGLPLAHLRVVSSIHMILVLSLMRSLQGWETRAVQDTLRPGCLVTSEECSTKVLGLPALVDGIVTGDVLLTVCEQCYFSFMRPFYVLFLSELCSISFSLRYPVNDIVFIPSMLSPP